MKFVIIGFDGPEGEAKRKIYRPAHLANMEPLDQAGRVVLAGPLTDKTGSLIVISGQLCLGADGKLDDAHKGKLGAEISPEAGKAAARLCAINLLAQLRAAIGDLDRVVRCVRLGGFINATPTFAALAPVMN